MKIWLLTLAGCAATTPTVPEVEAQVATPEAQFTQRLATYRTVVASVSIGETMFLMRGDHTGRFVLEGGEGGNDRVLWDGAHLTIDHSSHLIPGPPAVSLGAAVDAIVGAFITELRTGFANSTFTDELPSSTGFEEGIYEYTRNWRRLDLSGAADDGVRIFFGFNKVHGTLSSVRVLTPDGERIGIPYLPGTFVLGFGDWAWDVPVQADLDRKEAWSLDLVQLDTTLWANRSFDEDRLVYDGYPSDERTVAYHLRYNRYRPPFRAELSTGATPPPPVPQVESAYAYWEGSCSPGAVHAVPFDWVWRPQPGATDAMGVEAAIAGTCPISVEMKPSIRMKLAPGTQGKVIGTFKVKKLAPGAAVISNQPIQIQRTGPRKDESALSFAAPLGAVPLSQLEIQVSGTATLTCGSGSPSEPQHIGMAGIGDLAIPKLTWEGCRPEPPPRQ